MSLYSIPRRDRVLFGRGQILESRGLESLVRPTTETDRYCPDSLYFDQFPTLRRIRLGFEAPTQGDGRVSVLRGDRSIINAASTEQLNKQLFAGLMASNREGLVRSLCDYVSFMDRRGGRSG